VIQELNLMFKTEENTHVMKVSTKMILIEARRLAIEMPVTDFARTTSWCERFRRRNGLCVRTKTTIEKKHIE
jgi:hypothetical protein